MDTNPSFLFVSSAVAYELCRLFGWIAPAAPPVIQEEEEKKRKKKREHRELQEEEEEEEEEVKLLVESLNVLPHPEGGYFVETYRSGSTPMLSKGLTDPSGDTIPTSRDRGEQDDGIRNHMTSMIFFATKDAPILYFGVNESDHVHYYHGGGSYTYVIVHPNGKVERLVLGGDVQNGEHLQLVFPKGCFKAGHLNGSHCLIGEGVAPGFDFRDFSFCDEEMLEKRVATKSDLKWLIKYVKPDRRRNFDDYYHESSAK